MKRATLAADGQVTEPRDHKRDAQFLASAIRDALPGLRSLDQRARHCSLVLLTQSLAAYEASDVR